MCVKLLPAPYIIKNFVGREDNRNLKINYIHFKILANKTALQARRVLSDQVYKMGQGVMGFGSSKPPEEKIQATGLFAAFRGKSLTDLYRIRVKQTKVYGVENDILTTLKMLKTKKNLLLFFPYRLTFNQYHTMRRQ